MEMIACPLADDDGSGEHRVIDIQLKTVVLNRPTSLQMTSSPSSPTDPHHVCLV